MSETPALTGGFAARLLNRAEGQVIALRPGIAPVFAAEQARAAPVLEPSEDVLTAPMAQPAARAELPRSSAATDSASAPEFRLMPVVAKSIAPRQIAKPQPGANAEPATFQPAPAQANEPAAPHAIAGESLSGEPSAAGRLRPAPLRPKRGDSLSAAVLQLLGEGTGGPAAASAVNAGRFPPERHHGLDAALPTTLEPGASAARVTADPAAAPALTIHIGEIVVAPEPGPSAHSAQSPPPWQPPLSLSEYRARRAQERR